MDFHKTGKIIRSSGGEGGRDGGGGGGGGGAGGAGGHGGSLWNQDSVECNGEDGIVINLPPDFNIFDRRPDEIVQRSWRKIEVSDDSEDNEEKSAAFLKNKHGDDIYKIEDPKDIGYFLVFNQKNDRKGTEYDVNRLKECWENFNLTVEIFDDYSEEEIMNTIDKYSGQKPHQSIFIVCILSHGKSGVIKDVNNKDIQVKDVSSKILNCELLFGKPKLLLVQSCRGVTAPIGTQSAIRKKSEDSSISADADFETDAVECEIPLEADILIFFATVDNYVAYRNIKKGSIFIQDLCECIEKYKNEDLQSIFTKVNNKVSQSNLMQVSVSESTWRKKYYLI